MASGQVLFVCMTGSSLYRKVAEDIKAAIAAGTYPVNTKLPSESELAERYSVSRGTIRQAFAALRADGVIASRRGARRLPRLVPGPGAAAVRTFRDGGARRLSRPGGHARRRDGPVRRLDHRAARGARCGVHRRRARDRRGARVRRGRPAARRAGRGAAAARAAVHHRPFRAAGGVVRRPVRGLTDRVQHPQLRRCQRTVPDVRRPVIAQSWLYKLYSSSVADQRVVIVGGGVLGTMHAVMARRRGFSVVHLEREPEARGASVRNFGLVWVSGRRAGPELALALRARELWEEIAAWIGRAS